MNFGSLASCCLGKSMTREIVVTSTRAESKSDWATPDWFFSHLHARFDFTVDVCAAPYNRKLHRYFGLGGEAEDGLVVDWGGERVWCNPPYKEIGKWLEKAPEADAAVFLVPANTDTSWFHDLVVPRAGVVFLRGRLAFENLTPPEIDTERLLKVYQVRPTPKNRKALIDVLSCAGSEYVRKFPAMVKACNVLGVTVGDGFEERRAGPGFPSMLVVFHPDVDAGQYTTLGVKDIEKAAS